MSWASRRRMQYTLGVVAFFVILIGGPLAYWYLSIPATCDDGIQNQGETAPDRGGPCPLIDTHALSPAPILWARSFRVRSGAYNAVAYLQNPNQNAAAIAVPYHFGLYDAHNVLIAEREGAVSIMPGEITPIFAGNIDTGNRIAVHTYFNFKEEPTWEKGVSTVDAIKITAVTPTAFDIAPRITADVENTAVDDIRNVAFVAVVFDPAGNAYAASETALDILHGDERRTIFFSWPAPLPATIGRIDILPVAEPKPAH